MGQRLTGNRGSFFPLLRNFGKGGLGGLEPANHGKGPRANLEDGDSYHTRPARERAMHLPLFFDFPHQLHDVGARGAKELGGL